MALIQDSTIEGICDLFVCSLEIAEDVDLDPATNQTIVPVYLEDGSGTVVDIPAGTEIIFPPDVPEEIVVSTPVNPIDEAQIPLTLDTVIARRIFGPSPTTFNPPIEITIHYTDEEVAGTADETWLKVVKYNSVSGVFDIEVSEADIVNRDTSANTITFLTDSFSEYGIGTVSDVLSISITPDTWSIGELMAGEIKNMISSNALIVENNGTLTGTLSLQITDPGTGWTPGLTPGIETYVLRGLFCGTSDNPTGYFGIDDILSTIETLSTSSILGDAALSEDGVSIMPGTSVGLWLRFDAPLKTNRVNEQNLAVTIGIQPD